MTIVDCVGMDAGEGDGEMNDKYAKSCLQDPQALALPLLAPILKCGNYAEQSPDHVMWWSILAGLRRQQSLA